ncbi:hypothetical protein ACYATO_07155 [Lactobacillaceae bacterium Melli_B3]
MKYLSFEIKKILINKMNLFMLASLTIISVVFLFINLSAQRNDSISAYAKNSVSFYSNDIKKIKQGKSNNNFIKGDLFQLKKNLSLEKAIKNNDWLLAYQLKKDLNNYLISGSYSNPIADNFKRNNLLMDYLTLHKINNPESEAYPTHNLTFTVWFNNVIMPISMTIIIIFILGRLFSQKYFENINKNQLILISPNKQSLLDIFMGVVIFSLYYLAISIFNFVISSIIVGKIRWDYPYFVQHNGTMHYVPIDSIIIKSLLMQFLVIIFITVVIYLTSMICKKSMSTILYSIFVLIILSVATHIFGFLKAIASFLPTTYLDVIGVVSGNSIHLGSNFGFKSGMIVLSVSIIIIFSIIMLINNKKWNKERI